MRYCSVLVPLHVDALVASSASLEVCGGADLGQSFTTLSLRDGGVASSASLEVGNGADLRQCLLILTLRGT